MDTLRSHLRFTASWILELIGFLLVNEEAFEIVENYNQSNDNSGRTYKDHQLFPTHPFPNQWWETGEQQESYH